MIAVQRRTCDSESIPQLQIARLTLTHGLTDKLPARRKDWRMIRTGSTMPLDALLRFHPC